MEREVDQLVSLYEQRKINRRALIQGLIGLTVTSRAWAQSAGPAPIVRAHSLNHVSIIAMDIARSKAFYQRLTGLPVRDEGKDFCEFRLEGAFLGLYAPEGASDRTGIDHFCLGVESYEPKRLFERLKQTLPEAQPTVENGDQVYVRDPDGSKVQFADVRYKR